MLVNFDGQPRFVQLAGNHTVGTRVSTPSKHFAMRMQFETQTHDPMWGAIPLTNVEAELLRFPQLMRLGQIRQTGLAFFDFPTLTHSRLEHSIGVLHVADMIFTALEDADQLHPGLFGRKRYRQFRQAVRLAALLHDLGHPPFSHAVELTFVRYPSLLERAATGLPRRSPLRTLFDRYSHETFTQYGIRRLLHDRRVADLVSHLDLEVRHEIPDLAIGEATGCLAQFNGIISGEFDADRIDYLIRDNRRSGFAVGLSVDELHDAVHLREFAKDRYELYIDASALPFVNSVLSARQRLVRRVHLAPMGRTATQMLVNCLYGTFKRYAPAELRKTIIALHTTWTDFGFYHKLRENVWSESARRRTTKSKKLRGAERYFVERFPAVVQRMEPRNVWREHARLDFMHMHPCLRLLAHIAGTGGWDSPNALTFADGKQPVFVEVVAKPSQASDLMVDYDEDSAVDRTDAAAEAKYPKSLDFIGTTENRLGRAVLAQAMANLDVFVYRLDSLDKPRARIRSTGLRQFGVSGADQTYRQNLEGTVFLTAGAVTALGREQRKRWNASRKDMIATEYVLLVLYALDRGVRELFPGATDVYVYRSEYFVNWFLPRLATVRGDSRAAAALYPRLFRPPQARPTLIDQKRVFSQIQRLAAFGLILTRSNTAFNISRDQKLGATRSNVYSTREEIQINAWGRHYVEKELSEMAGFEAMIKTVYSRQNSVRRDLDRMAKLLDQLETQPGAQLDRPEVASRAQKRHATAMRIHQNRGCAMTFTRPGLSAASERRPA